MKYLYIKLLLLITVVSIATSCATRGTPTGGPKDSIPPVMIDAIPNIESIHFKSNKIKIEFDEFVKLENVSTALVVSPPLKNELDISPSTSASKTISIKINDTLLPNTTYSINFGNSIVDYNEGNKLKGFKYVFSTGSYLDSLNIKGEVNNPSVKESVSGIDVMLYEFNETYTDSIIYKEKPRYLGNTLDTTLYNITHLKKGKYLMIALEDANNNKIYNPKTDKIGFVEDTILLPTDSIYNITLFKEVPQLKVIKPMESTKGHLLFGYEGDAKNIDIKLLTETPENFTSEIIFDKEKDTIHYWYTPFETDSLNFEVSKNNYFAALKATPRTKKVDSINISHSGNNLHLLDTFYLKSTTPISKFNPVYIKLEKTSDSSMVKYNAILSKNKQKLFLDFEKDNESQYKLELLPEAITDMFGMVSDSLNYSFKTKKPEDYSKLTLTFDGDYKKPIIIELLNKKNEVIRTLSKKTPEEVTFELLEPTTYFVRITLDKNGNKKWDTGNFLKRIQPEKIIYLKKEIEMTANFYYNEVFTIN